MKTAKSQEIFQSRNRVAVAGVLALGAAYLFASWAIDSGSILAYGLAFFSLVWAAKMIHRALFFNTNGSNT